MKMPNALAVNIASECFAELQISSLSFLCENMIMLNSLDFNEFVVALFLQYPKNILSVIKVFWPYRHYSLTLQ